MATKKQEGFWDDFKRPFQRSLVAFQQYPFAAWVESMLGAIKPPRQKTKNYISGKEIS